MDDEGNHTILREVLTFVLKQQGGIENCIIDDIGEFFGMEANNTDFEEYRKNNPGWNQLPYDLEFNMGCMAVSYTHLDVYKRQLHPRNSVLAQSNAAAASPIFADNHQDNKIDVTIGDIILENVRDTDTLSRQIVMRLPTQIKQELSKRG